MKHTSLLPVENLRLLRSDGTLTLHLDDESTPLAPPKRALPLGAPDQWILLYDECNNELGVVANVADLDEESQWVLRGELQRRYKTTDVLRILEVERDPLSGRISWRVEVAEQDKEKTDDGKTDDEKTDNSRSAADNANAAGGKSTDAGLLKRVLPQRVLPLRSRGEDDNGSNNRNTGQGKSHGQGGGRIRLGAAREPLGPEQTFFINGPEDVQTARYPHIFIIDSDGSRYQITNCEALDLDSRRAAERYF